MNDISMNDISMNDISMNDISMNDISSNDISLNDILLNDISENNINYKKNKYFLIKTTIILLAIEFKLLLLLNNIKDRLIIYFAIYGQILLIFSLIHNKYSLIEISHLIFGLTILLVLFCSFNPYLNLYCYNIILFTLFTRYKYGGCLLLNCNKNNIDLLPNGLNYSAIYKSLFFLIMVKLAYIFTN